LGVISGIAPGRVKETVYRTIVRSKLEYASASWHPHYEKDITTLKRVQTKAARFSLENYDRIASVSNMLKELQWDTLDLRRKKNRLALMYKLSHSLLDIQTEKYLVPNNETRTRKSHAFDFFCPRSMVE